MDTNVNCMLGMNIEGVVKRHFSYSACGTPSYVWPPSFYDHLLLIGSPFRSGQVPCWNSSEFKPCPQNKILISFRGKFQNFLGDVVHPIPPPQKKCSPYLKTLVNLMITLLVNQICILCWWSHHFNVPGLPSVSVKHITVLFPVIRRRICSWEIVTMFMY